MKVDTYYDRICFPFTPPRLLAKMDDDLLVAVLLAFDNGNMYIDEEGLALLLLAIDRDETSMKASHWAQD